jgi:hypothetical protein
MRSLRAISRVLSNRDLAASEYYNLIVECAHLGFFRRPDILAAVS